FTWSVPSSAPDSGFVFDTTNGPQVKLTPGGNGIYNVRLVVAGALQHADVLSQVFVSCPDVLPKTGTISLASSTPGYPAGTFFRDDTATLSAAPSSLCFSAGSTAFTFLWSLTPPEGSHSVLSSTTAATPALVADVSAGTWTASVTVLDKLGNRSLPATATTLRPGGNATYTITAHASGSKSGNTASPSRDIDVLCGDVTPTKVTNPSISAVMPPGGTDGFTRAIGQFFRDDVVTLSAAGSSTCFSPGNTSFTYAWTLSPVNPPAL